MARKQVGTAASGLSDAIALSDANRIFKRDLIVATGVDQTAELQAKYDALPDGGTLQIMGQVRTLAPIVLARNKTIRGEVSPRWSYQTTPPTSIRPMAAFAGKAVVLIPEHTIVDASLTSMATARALANDNGRIENLAVDCSAINPGGDRGIYGVLFEGLVRNWEIRNCATLSARGIGIAFRQERGTGVPRGITAEHLQAVYSKSYGFYLAYTTDSNMVDLLAVGGETDGHYHLACAETHFEDVRAVFNKGRGVVLAGVRSVANTVTYGSISTDRNALDGLSIQQSGTFPLRIGTATLNRDGSASGTLDYAGLVLGADAVRIAPVTIGYLSVSPGVDDPAVAGETGGGIFSPQHVVRQGNTTRVEIGSRLGWSAGTPIFESGATHSNPPFTSYDYLRSGTDGTVVTSKNWVETVAAITPGGGSATVIPSTTQTALARLYAGIAKRDSAPVLIGTGGSSTSGGQGATNDNRAQHNRWINMMQIDYPKSDGSAHPTQRDYSAGMTFTTNGIQHIRAGEGGTNSGTYLSTAKSQGLGALGLTAFAHQIGSNDYSINRNPATVKSDILSWAQQMDAAAPSGAPKPVHILIFGHRRTNVSSPTYSWNSYGAVMAQLAAEYPDMFVFVNLYEAYRKVGQDSVYQHYMMYATGGPNDSIHLTDAGHAFGADQLRAATREDLLVNTAAPTVADPANPTAPADTTAPTISTFTATSGNTQNVLAWDGTDNVAITRWLLKRASTTIYDGTAKTYTDTGLTNDTSYSYVLQAFDAAGNSVTANASATPAAVANPTLTNSTAPAITPSPATTGQTMTTTNGSWSATPDSYTYQWFRGATAISGATAQTYVLVVADEGQSITCRVTAIKSGYTTSAATASNAVTPTAAAAGGAADYTSGMMFDFDADTTTAANGAASDTWTSQGGSLGALVLSKGSAAPTVVTGAINGHRSLSFVGGSQTRLLSPGTTAPVFNGTGVTYAYVFKRTGAIARAIGSINSGNYHTLFDTLSANGVSFGIEALSGSILTYGVSILNKWVVIIVSAAGAASKMRIDNTTVTGTLNTSNGIGLSVGGSGSGSGYGMFELTKWRAFDHAFTDAEITSLESYLKSRYAIA